MDIERSPFKDICYQVADLGLSVKDYMHNSDRHSFLCKYYGDSSYVKVLTPNIFNDNFDDLEIEEPVYIFYLTSYTGVPIGFYLRSIEQKSSYYMLMLSPVYRDNFLFSIWENWNNKKFHDPVICVEGVIDALVVSTVYPYTLAFMNVSPNDNKLGVLTSLTSSIHLMLDNDAAGKKGMDRIRKKIQDYEDIFVNQVIYSMSDPGDYVKNILRLKGELRYLSSYVVKD